MVDWESYAKDGDTVAMIVKGLLRDRQNGKADLGCPE